MKLEVIKKIIGNFKQDQEHKENNKNKQNVINAVFKKIIILIMIVKKRKRKIIMIVLKKNIFQKFNQLKPLLTSNKMNKESLKKKIKDNINNFDLSEGIENKIIENGKEEIINKSVIESI